jgi:SAM-dependent methyltransferase
MAMIPPPGPTLASAREARVDSWTSYWRGGALHSCAGSFAGNYAGPIREFWEARFAELPGSAQVLDACCGNAPLSQLLCAHPAFTERQAEIDAVDLAEIAPPWVDTLPTTSRARVRVHPRVDVALLPFDEGRFALCMSQFGVEYADPAALAELRRVLAPGGWLAALIHHAAALPVRIAREELEHADWLRDEKLAEQARALIAPMARAATAAGQQALRADTAANDLRARFNGSLQRLQMRAEAASFPDLLEDVREALMAVLQRARLAGEADAEAALGRWNADYLRGLLRQRELIEHARDAEQMEFWLHSLSGLSPQLSALRFGNGELAAWALLAQRPR